MIRVILRDDIKRLEIEREKATDAKIDKEMGRLAGMKAAHREELFDKIIEEDPRTLSINYLYELVDELDKLEVCESVHIISTR